MPTSHGVRFRAVFLACHVFHLIHGVRFRAVFLSSHAYQLIYGGRFRAVFRVCHANHLINGVRFRAVFRVSHAYQLIHGVRVCIKADQNRDDVVVTLGGSEMERCYPFLHEKAEGQSNYEDEVEWGGREGGGRDTGRERMNKRKKDRKKEGGEWGQGLMRQREKRFIANS